RRPFQRLHVDLIGPLPVTPRGNQYVLVAVDALTKWPEIFAIPEKSAEVVAECIVDEIICRHGPPETLVTDQGKEFANVLLQQIAHLLDVRKITTTPYHPQSDGQVERVNKEVSNILHFHVEQQQTEWDAYL